MLPQVTLKAILNLNLLTLKMLLWNKNLIITRRIKTKTEIKNRLKRLKFVL